MVFHLLPTTTTESEREGSGVLGQRRQAGGESRKKIETTESSWLWLARTIVAKPMRCRCDDQAD